MTVPINANSGNGLIKNTNISDLATNNKAEQRQKASEQINSLFTKVAGNTNSDNKVSADEMVNLIKAGVPGVAGDLGKLGNDAFKGLKDFDLSKLNTEADVQAANNSIRSIINNWYTQFVKDHPEFLEFFGGTVAQPNQVETETNSQSIETPIDNSAYEDFRESKPES